MSNNKIREGSLKDKYMNMGDKIHYIHYYDFLKMIPSINGSKESLLLSFLIDEDGKDYDKHPDIPSYFRCSRSSMAEATSVTTTTIDEYLAHLQAWGFIKYDSFAVPGKSTCTYVELQNDLIDLLAKCYYLTIKYEPKNINTVKRFNRYLLNGLIDHYKTVLQTTIKRLTNSKNNKESLKNYKGSSSSSRGTSLEDEDNKNNFTERPEDPDNWTYSDNLTVPKAWLLTGDDKWGHDEFIKKLAVFDNYLREYPRHRDWYLDTSGSFIQGIERANRVMDYEQKERDIRL